jgi:hypothetical protein
MRKALRSWRLGFSALALTACLHARHGGPELVGQWTIATTAPDGVHGTTATYDFKDDGSFEMSGYPPIQVKGRWQVTERSKGLLRLKLTEQDMTTNGHTSRWNDEDGWGELADAGRTFKYNGKVFRKGR